MTQIYRSRWNRNFFISLACYLRDAIVLALPIKRLPKILIRLLYGVDAKFAFLVHPRFYQDVYISSPFLNPLKFILRKKTAYKFLSRMPPFVLNSVRTKQGADGFVVAQITLPELMSEERKYTISVMEKSLKLVSKITREGAVVGLGGWLPMISRRGAALEKCAEKLGLKITNGHCGTLTSIYLTIEKLAQIGGINMKELSIAIIGVGKMGTNVARALKNKVGELFLIDINKNNLGKIKNELKLAGDLRTRVETLLNDPRDMVPLRNILKKCHIGVCTTSAYRKILRVNDMPDGFIAIDDARPEALPRDPKNERLVLEGGLLKIKDAIINYDYGFGLDNNVFGCLGEAFMLALSNGENLKPTLGDVDIQNFLNMLNFSRENGVLAGDLKSSEDFISHEDVKEAFFRRGFIQNE